MSRTVINSFGHLMRRMADPMIREPVKAALREGADDFLRAAQPTINNALNNLGSSAATIAAGATIGGLISGAASFGGSVLSEIFRNYNEKKNNDVLVEKLMAGLRANQQANVYPNMPQPVMPGNLSVNQLSQDVF